MGGALRPRQRLGRRQRAVDAAGGRVGGGAGGLLSAGAVALTVVAVEAVSGPPCGCWNETSSDGARASLTLAGAAVGGASVLAGTAVVATAFSAGWVLSAAGKAIAFIPNQIGQALLYNERVTR
jgi:hypothetical protein